MKDKKFLMNKKLFSWKNKKLNTKISMTPKKRKIFPN